MLLLASVSRDHDDLARANDASSWIRRADLEAVPLGQAQIQEEESGNPAGFV